MRKALSLAVIPIVFALIAADQQPTPSASPTGTAVPTGGAVPAGTVTSVVDPGLLTHGKNVLHGITRDPKTGDLVVGVGNLLRHWNPIMGTSFSNDDSLRRITPSGTVSRLTSFPYPNALAFGPRDGMLYVATGAIGCNEMAGGFTVSHHCPGTNGIVVVDPVSGDHHDFVGKGPGYTDGVGTNAGFTAVGGIAYAPASGNFYLADTEDQRIRQVTAEGTVTTIAGGGTKGSADGVGPAAMFAYPRGIAYCPTDKNLYVADTDNNEIRKVSLDGTVTTFAGAPEAGYAEGTASAARFDHPRGIACDANGILYIADSDNNAIREITPAGMVSTLAGTKQMGTVNAVGPAARFSNPTDMWYEASDHSLYIIDLGANNVRKVTTAAP